MTILTGKDNPPSKPFEGSIHEKEGTWWVAKTKPRQEKAFAFDLLEYGIDYYLPYYEKKTMRSDGKFRKSYLLLFPSYVPFISENPFQLLSKNKISTILPIRDQVLFKTQIHQIFLSITNSLRIEPVDYCEWHDGDVAIIGSGPLKGISGKIGKKSSGLILNVDGLGTAKIKVDHDQMLHLVKV